MSAGKKSCGVVTNIDGMQPNRFAPYGPEESTLNGPKEAKEMEITGSVYQSRTNDDSRETVLNCLTYQPLGLQL